MLNWSCLKSVLFTQYNGKRRKHLHQPVACLTLHPLVEDDFPSLGYIHQDGCSLWQKWCMWCGTVFDCDGSPSQQAWSLLFLTHPWDDGQLPGVLSLHSLCSLKWEPTLPYNRPHSHFFKTGGSFPIGLLTPKTHWEIGTYVDSVVLSRLVRQSWIIL